MSGKLTDKELSDLCADLYANMSTCRVVRNDILYVVFRELIDLRALRDGKPAFTPRDTMVGEAAQAGAICDDTEAEPAHL